MRDNYTPTPATTTDLPNHPLLRPWHEITLSERFLGALRVELEDTIGHKLNWSSDQLRSAAMTLLRAVSLLAALRQC